MNISILDLQFFQDMHDRQYHKDIYHMPLIRRVSHLYNHLDKYASTPNRMGESYPDALACMLSMANALNVNFIAELTKWSGDLTTTIATVPLMYREDCLPRQLKQVLGKFAKIIEGHDHTESIDYRGELKENLIELFIIWAGVRVDLDGCSLSSWTLEYLKKIFELKKKSIFFPYLHSDDMCTPLYRSIYHYASKL